jgi:putative flippase GtrA
MDWYKKMEEVWFELPQKLRFLLVGGFNTVAAYVVFVGLYFLSGGRHNLSLALQWLVSVNLSIFTMRYYVFRSRGGLLKEYCKAAGVYVYMFGFNIVFLNILVNGLKINAPAAQAAYLAASTIITYLLHKYFSFRRK